MLSFEKTKKCVDSKTFTTIRIPISWSMGTSCMKYFGKGVDKVIKENSHLGVSFDNGSIVIVESKTKHMFESVIQNTVSHVRNKLLDERLHGLEYVLLVGGFAECKYFQDACIKAFGEETQVLIPMSAQLAIIKGNCYFKY